MGKNIEVVEKIINGKKYWKVSDALRTIDETDIAYSAGIIDGEGSIIVGKGKQPVGNGYYYEILVSVHMMDGYVPEYMAECFGGKRKQSPVNHPNKKGNFAYYYHANGSRSKILLSLVLPFLKIKRRQAEAAIYLQDKLSKNPRGKRVTAEMVEERERIRNLIHDLKQIPVNGREEGI
jgi:hypothetical protein